MRTGIVRGCAQQDRFVYRASVLATVPARTQAEEPQQRGNLGATDRVHSRLFRLCVNVLPNIPRIIALPQEREAQSSQSIPRGVRRGPASW